MIRDHLSRFQADIWPDDFLQIEGFWQRIAQSQDSPEDSPVLGPLEQKLSASYTSLTDADQAAIAFPAFQALASQFATAPFTTIANLLWELRQAQEQAQEQAQALAQAQAQDEPPFEGDP